MNEVEELDREGPVPLGLSSHEKKNASDILRSDYEGMR
jgi:hypothetical protein